MSAYNLQPSQTDRISAPAGLTQPEPYDASEGFSRVDLDRPRYRSRSRERRRERIREDDSISSVEMDRWTRNSRRYRSRSKVRRDVGAIINPPVERERDRAQSTEIRTPVQIDGAPRAPIEVTKRIYPALSLRQELNSGASVEQKAHKHRHRTETHRAYPGHYDQREADLGCRRGQEGSSEEQDRCHDRHSRRRHRRYDDFRRSGSDSDSYPVSRHASRRRTNVRTPTGRPKGNTPELLTAKLQRHTLS